jgi:hypothetical protein
MARSSRGASRVTAGDRRIRAHINSRQTGLATAICARSARLGLAVGDTGECAGQVTSGSAHRRLWAVNSGSLERLASLGDAKNAGAPPPATGRGISRPC